MGTMCLSAAVLANLFGGLDKRDDLGNRLLLGGALTALDKVGLIFGQSLKITPHGTLLGGRAFGLAFTLGCPALLVALGHEELILVILGIATGTPLLGFITHGYMMLVT